MYDKPWFNAAITFVEPFPVGVVMTLVSAAALSRKRKPERVQGPVRSVDRMV